MNKDVINNIDLNCITAPYDISFFPTLTSGSDFDVDAYVAQMAAIEEMQGDVAATLYEVPSPSAEVIMDADRAVYSTVGDRRFDGLAAHNFLHTRYKALDITDTFTETTPTITITGCDNEGYPYTYTAVNTAYFLDQASNIVTFPVFDYYGTQVYFPLVDENGKFILHQPLTAIDNKQQTVYFPLKDINNLEIIFPFKDAAGTTVIIPPSSTSEKLLDVSQAYRDLDTAYKNAKDSDAFKFVQYVLQLENTHKISFFFGTAEVAVQNNTYFAAAVYELSASAADTNNIISSNLNYLIRYYADRADLVYDIYKDNGGQGPFNIIQKTSSTDSKDIIENDRIRLASYNILNIPYWSPKNTEASHYREQGISTPVVNVHTSLLELHTNTVTSSNEIINLKTEIQTLCSTVISLSSKLDALLANFNTTQLNVNYNSGIIDTLVISANWQNIWEDSISSLFVKPSTPAPRV